MEDFLTFMIWPIVSMIIASPIVYLTFTLGFRWVDFMHSLKAKSFFYTKFGLKFRTTYNRSNGSSYNYIYIVIGTPIIDTDGRIITGK